MGIVGDFEGKMFEGIVGYNICLVQVVVGDEVVGFFVVIVGIEVGIGCYFGIEEVVEIIKRYDLVIGSGGIVLAYDVFESVVVVGFIFIVVQGIDVWALGVV